MIAHDVIAHHRTLLLLLLLLLLLYFADTIHRPPLQRKMCVVPYSAFLQRLLADKLTIENDVVKYEICTPETLQTNS